MFPLIIQENFMIDVHSDEIGIDISDPSLGTLSKAFKFATRTRIKVVLNFLK